MRKKKLAFMILASMLAVVLAVSGATVALFTSTTTNANNDFTAGTINLVADRNHGDYIPGPMFYPNSLDPDGRHAYDVVQNNPSGEALGGWAPGDKVDRRMILRNTGTLDALVTGIKATPRASYTQTLRPANQGGTGGTRTAYGLTSGPEYEEFIEKANVRVSNSDNNIIIYEGPLKDLIFSDENEYADVTEILEIQATGILNITFEVTLDLSASNALQAKTFIFDFGFYAEQKRNNPRLSNHNLAGSNVQIALSWLHNNADLDAHLTGPNNNNGRFHVRWNNMSYSENNTLHAFLNADHWNGPATETITINNVKATGMYRFSVHRYNFPPTLSASGAEVKVYKDGALIATYPLPSGAGNAINLWTVLEIQDGVLVPINTLSSAGVGGIQSLSTQSNDAHLIEALPEKE